MDLLKTILIYMSMVFVSSVNTAPEATSLPLEPLASPTAIVQTVTPTPVPTATPTPVPTPAITPNSVYKTLKVGDKGDAVKTLQRRLAELGYYTGDIDGVFGNQTRRAVERFQYYHGLTADGIAGRRTQTVLYESKDIVFAPVDVTPPPPTPTPTPTKTPRPIATTPMPTFVPTPTPSVKPTATPKPTDTLQPTYTPAYASTASLPPTATSTDSLIPSASPASTMTPPEDTQASPLPETEVPPTDALPPQGEATPDAEETFPMKLEEYSFRLDGMESPVMSLPISEGVEPMVLSPLSDAQGMVFVPLDRILQDGGIYVILQTNEEAMEYGFALPPDLYLLTFTLSPEGTPAELSFYKNSQPQLMENRTALLMDGILYLPIEDVQKITGISFTLDEETKVYTITLPAAP